MTTRVLRRLFGILVLVCASVAGQARADDVWVLLPRADLAYERFLQALRGELRERDDDPVQLRVGYTDRSDLDPPEAPRLVVTVGLEAARHYYGLNGAPAAAPVMSVMIPRAAFEALEKPEAMRVSALYLDQPLHRQIALVRAILPEAERLGVIVGPATEAAMTELAALAHDRGLTLVTERAVREVELYPALQAVLRGSDALLALPDPYIINTATAQNLLLTSFRYRRPVIGYSAAYVRAGALAAVFSSPEDIGRETAQRVSHFLRGREVQDSGYPRLFSIATNRPLADNLGVTLPDESELHRRVADSPRPP